MIAEAKKSPEKSKRRPSKAILSDDSDSGEASKDPDPAKENLVKSDDQEEFHEFDQSPAKKAKKRKKKFKIVDDSSNSSSEAIVSVESVKVLSEIVNSDNSQNIKVSYSSSEVQATRVVEQVAIGGNSDSDSDSDTDDDLPLSMKVSMPKRQRLILSDGEDE